MGSILLEEKAETDTWKDTLIKTQYHGNYDFKE